MNIFWPIYAAMESSFPTTILGTVDPDFPKKRLSRKLAALRLRTSVGPSCQQRVLEQLDPSGPNVLWVFALGSRDLIYANLLEPIWSKFDYTVLNVVDTLQPDNLKPDDVNKFDLVTCFCGDLTKDFDRISDVPSIFFPAHSDILNAHSASSYRPLDLIVVGRRDRKLLAPIHKYFNAPERERVFIDLLTRTQMDHGAEDQFQILSGTYAKSKAAFCFEPSNVGRFQGYSPLTSRWIHAWAAGCSVIGSRPTGTGVAQQMDWPEATLELPSDPDAAIEFIERLLADEAGLAKRRNRNVAEALRRHDTRHRFRDVLSYLDIPIPPLLQQGLAELEARADALDDTTRH